VCATRASDLASRDAQITAFCALSSRRRGGSSAGRYWHWPTDPRGLGPVLGSLRCAASPLRHRLGSASSSARWSGRT